MEGEGGGVRQAKMKMMMMMTTAMVTAGVLLVMMCAAAGRRGVPLPHQTDDEGSLYRGPLHLAPGLRVGTARTSPSSASHG